MSKATNNAIDYTVPFTKQYESVYNSLDQESKFRFERGFLTDEVAATKVMKLDVTNDQKMQGLMLITDTNDIKEGRQPRYAESLLQKIQRGDSLKQYEADHAVVVVHQNASNPRVLKDIDLLKYMGGPNDGSSTLNKLYLTSSFKGEELAQIDKEIEVGKGWPASGEDKNWITKGVKDVFNTKKEYGPFIAAGAIIAAVVGGAAVAGAFAPAAAGSGAGLSSLMTQSSAGFSGGFAAPASSVGGPAFTGGTTAAAGLGAAAAAGSGAAAAAPAAAAATPGILSTITNATGLTGKDLFGIGSSFLGTAADIYGAGQAAKIMKESLADALKIAISTEKEAMSLSAQGAEAQTKAAEAAAQYQRTGNVEFKALAEQLYNQSNSMQQAANAKQQELINSGYDAANKTIDPVLAQQKGAFDMLYQRATNPTESASFKREQQQLDQVMASRGLHGSGAGIEANRRMIEDEYEKQFGRLSQVATMQPGMLGQRMQNDLGRSNALTNLAGVNYTQQQGIYDNYTKNRVTGVHAGTEIEAGLQTKLGDIQSGYFDKGAQSQRDIGQSMINAQLQTGNINAGKIKDITGAVSEGFKGLTDIFNKKPVYDKYGKLVT